MTITYLEDALVEFVAQNTAEMRFPSNEQTDEMVEPRVWSGFIPRDEVGAVIPSDITTYPAIIISAQQGVQESDHELITVVFVIGVFDANLDQQGYKDCINIVQRLKDRFREVDIIQERYMVDPPIKWEISKRDRGMDSYPYFFAEMQLQFKLFVPMSQFDITTGDGDVTPGRYNAVPIPAPSPSQHSKLTEIGKTVKIIDHYGQS